MFVFEKVKKRMFSVVQHSQKFLYVNKKNSSSQILENRVKK
ncbi:hypothetical protein EVA_06275 [gut metagenome]|uniref:Uncharacterized protein n=1 Tax=gut metagenome TaxID=749906 RepID=J9GFB4_9ZZZZ